jgi:hypothetical protein
VHVQSVIFAAAEAMRRLNLTMATNLTFQTGYADEFAYC